MLSFSRFRMGFFLLLYFCLLSCTPSQPNICMRGGQRYCVTQDWVPVITWDACYRRGLSCMEGECWEYAIDEFRQAIDLRYKDRRDVRAYGMHFRDEYFPHREMGIAFFHLERFEDALHELTLSLSQTSSARARYYLNKTRRSHLLITGQDEAAPDIHLECPEEEYLTSQTPLHLKGTVHDDQFVAAVSINHNPLFIELAQPLISFTHPVDLEEGWNTIDITARDLVDRENKKSIRVYLDRQGPRVMLKPLRKAPASDSGQVSLAILLYDRSGVVSFQLNDREVPRVGLDRFCLVEETITTPFQQQAIPFLAQDRAGNITRGEIHLLPDRPKTALRIASSEPKTALRIASSDTDEMPPGLGSQAFQTEEEAIILDIFNPSEEEVTTCYREIFLEGEIEAKNGIGRIELNHREISDLHEIEAFREKNHLKIVTLLEKQNRDPERFMQTVGNILRGDSLYYLNKKISLQDNFTILDLTVEDKKGMIKSRQFRIRKIPREEIFQSEQRMLLAILPFGIGLDSTYHRQRQDYINKKVIESFADQERFNLIEEADLPRHILEMTRKAGKAGHEEAAQQIGSITSADGVICGNIQKWMDGIEIEAVFREVEKGDICLFHDVFTPIDTARELKTIIAGLAMKFRDSFPVCTGTIIDTDGRTIYVNIGSEKGLFPGMGYNIFMNEQELISRASIKKVEEGTSEAKVHQGREGLEVEEGYRVRTR